MSEHDDRTHDDGEPHGELLILIEVGEHGTLLTVIQALATFALFEERDIAAWHMCDGGCCVLAHEPGMDETAWRVSDHGHVEKIDHYGNVIETLFDSPIN